MARGIRWVLLSQAFVLFSFVAYGTVEKFDCGDDCVESVNARVDFAMWVTIAVEAWLTLLLLVLVAEWVGRRNDHP